MLKEIDLRRLETIADHAESLFKTIQDDRTICKVEALLRQGIMYQAALAQARCVEPRNGWDRYGR